MHCKYQFYIPMVNLLRTIHLPLNNVSLIVKNVISLSSSLRLYKNRSQLSLNRTKLCSFFVSFHEPIDLQSITDPIDIIWYDTIPGNATTTTCACRGLGRTRTTDTPASIRSVGPSCPLSGWWHRTSGRTCTSWCCAPPDHGTCCSL